MSPLVLHNYSLRGDKRGYGHQEDAPATARAKCCTTRRCVTNKEVKIVNSEDSKKIQVSTPGRICLFGEHQDYLQLPVIACAISLRIRIHATPRNDSSIQIDLPDLGEHQSLSLNSLEDYRHERDYFRSGLKVMREAGFAYLCGFDCSVHGEIPINAGTSSSSALVVSWIHLLSYLGERKGILTVKDIATLAHRAEVEEFHEPGGSMDHYTTAVGGVVHIQFYPVDVIDPLPSPSGRFVLGDSGEPKDTKKVLSRSKDRVLAINENLKKRDARFSLYNAATEDLDRLKRFLSTDEYRLLEGTLRNRDITREARSLMASDILDEKKFGSLLLDHQAMLRDVLGISTRKIDKMLDAACQAGALGGKINGSGGGGCMFAYAPEHTEEIAAAIEREGGKSYIVTIAEGTKREL